MGISIFAAGRKESDLYFTPIGEAIRFGLAAIKNVGENTAKRFEIRGWPPESSRPYTILRAN